MKIWLLAILLASSTLAQGESAEADDNPADGFFGWEPSRTGDDGDAGLAVYQSIQREIDGLEQTAYQAVRLTGAFKLLQTVTGIGKILGLTIMLETGTIERFAGPGNFAS